MTTKKRSFVDVRAMGRKREDTEPHIVIWLNGPKGGRLGNAAISIDEARKLLDELPDAIARLLEGDR